jgi:integrase
MYVSYTPPPSGPLATALTGAGIPCKGGRADARTRTGDPFITSKALAPDAGPREGTPAPITTAIHAGAPSGPETPRAAQETAAVYAIYTPRAPRDGFTRRFTDACSAEHCIACGHRLKPRDPTPYCRACWDDQHDPITSRVRSRADRHGRRLAMSLYTPHPPRARTPIEPPAGPPKLILPSSIAPPVGPELDRRGRRRGKANRHGAHRGVAPANKGGDFGPAPPTIQEIMAMLGACPDTPYGHRLFAALVLCWQGALRAFEGLALVAGDLDAEAGTISIRHGKGDKAATITMAQWAWPLLDEWLAIRATLPNPDGPVLCVIDPPTAGLAWSYEDMRLRFKRIAQTAGVTKRFSPHQLRHAWAAQNFLQGVDVRTLQLHLRHANLGVTDTYLQGLGLHVSAERVYRQPVPTIPATALLDLARRRQ